LCTVNQKQGGPSATDFREVAPARAASLSMVRALALLVDRLTVQVASAASAASPGAASAGERRDAVREALRMLAASARAGALQCRVDERGLHVNEALLTPSEIRTEPALLALARRLVNHAVGTLSIRQGAAPGELLTLGRLLAEPPSAIANAMQAEHVSNEGSRYTPTEVLRTWSVLVTPASTPTFEEGALSPTIGSAMARLRSSRTDETARAAVESMLELARDAELRKDAPSVEAITLTLAQHARVIGPNEGRLAVEGGLRRLLREGVINLLAARVPESRDRDALIGALARTGEMGGRALVTQLMAAEDRPARRCYFDAIVAQDSGRSQLREALSDPRWYVVRNAAALLGEMGMAEADAPLIPLLSHLDERIRIAAARALTRLRTTRGLSALQQRLGDSNAEVRRLAAAAFGLSSAIAGTPKPNSGPLAAALLTETDEDVALEMIAALGKLASPDAVQRLIRMSLDTSEKSVERAWFRVATLEALVEARGHAAAATLGVATSDANEEVAAAARRLLEIVLRR
jgi:hypothetical protein